MKYLLLFIILFVGEVATAQSPQISYRVANKDTNANCYDVYFKSSEDLNDVFVMDYTLTVIAPEGWGNKIGSLSAERGQAQMEVLHSFKQGSKNTDYLFFYSTIPFRVTMSKKEEKKLFSFCVNTNCGEPLRLIRGVSLSSKNTYATNAVTDGAEGPMIDAVPKGYDFFNSMNLFLNAQIYEAYFGGLYGSVQSCPTNYQLTKTTSKPSLDINTDAQFNYTVKLINGFNPINGIITLTDTLQTGQVLESIIAPNGWTCSQTTNLPTIITCQNLGTIAASDTAQLILNVRATQGTILNNQAYASEGGSTRIVTSNLVQINTKSINPCDDTKTVNGQSVAGENVAFYSDTAPNNRVPIEQAQNTLNTELKTFVENTNVKYRAGKSITLSPGFSIVIQPNATGSFLVEIGGCK